MVLHICAALHIHMWTLTIVADVFKQTTLFPSTYRSNVLPAVACMKLPFVRDYLCRNAALEAFIK